MSSGGGKGGKKETATTIPDWVRGPAERNLRRAEQVQQLNTCHTQAHRLRPSMKHKMRQ